jgi:hypothetical protein
MVGGKPGEERSNELEPGDAERENPQGTSFVRSRAIAGQALAISLRQFHYRRAILALGALRLTTSV